MLAVLTSHPIQYQVPIWRALQESGRIPFRVWYLTNHGLEESRDPGFGKSFAWDMDMSSGYDHQFLSVHPNWTLKRFRGVRLSESLAERLRQEQIRVLWVEGWRFKVFWDAVRIAKRHGADVWLRGDSNDLVQDPLWKSAIKRPLLGYLFRRVDQFLCVGEANRRLYRSYGVTNERLQRTPHCVDNDRFTAEAKALDSQRSAIRERWKIPQDAFCVLFCGKFTAVKRPLDLISAVNQLNQEQTSRAPIHLLFVGSGPLGADMRRHCDVVFDADDGLTSDGTCKSKPRASFAGFLNQAEISRAYVAADLLVLSSESETWGLVANEAMACGTPVVVGNKCGCAEDLITKLDPRLVFQCGHIEDLAATIRYAISAGISKQRVQSAADTHHLRHTVETIEALYRDTIGLEDASNGAQVSHLQPVSIP